MVYVAGVGMWMVTMEERVYDRKACMMHTLVRCVDWNHSIGNVCACDMHGQHVQALHSWHSR